MDVFLVNVSSFPVVVYTFILFIVVFYWVLALIGSVDIELFDTDIDVDVASDIEVEGLGGVTGFMLKWGLTGVPVTVVISLLAVIAWMVCYFIVSIGYPLIPFESIKPLIGVVVLIISFIAAIPLTTLLIKPFKGLFVTHTAVRKVSLIGKDCIVKTGLVNNDFGQAVLEDGGAGMLLDVRADSALGIKKGDWVILVDYDENDGSYTVVKAE